MLDQNIQNNDLVQLSALAVRWFSSNKKTRKQLDWTPLYSQIIAFLMHEVDISQLLISPTVLHQSSQVLLNSLVCLQIQKDETFAQCLGVEVLILLQGTLLIDEKQSEIKGFNIFQALPVNRMEKSHFRSKEKCIILKGQRKVFQKFRNDILKLDREEKEAFISKHLFCGLTPVYPLAAVRLIQFNQAIELRCEQNAIYLLQKGLVHRKPKRNGQGTQLTPGSILNAKFVSRLLQMNKNLHQGQEILQTIFQSLIIKFQADELLRIVKLNPKLKKILQHKLRVIFQERQYLQAKSIELEENFTNPKLGSSTVRKHYPIEFKTRPKTAQLGRSFRRKRKNQNLDENIGDFITFDRYQKMLASKEKVVVAKSCFQLEVKGRAIIAFDFEKKLKMQNKMIKIQTGKIKRLRQKDSVTENTHMKEIKKKLFQVTHLFEQPLIDPKSVATPIIKENIERKPSTNRRMSGLKPEQYLKQEYLNAFLSQSGSQPRLKDKLNEGKMIPQSLIVDKQNMSTNHFSKNENLLCIKKKSAFKKTINSTVS